MPIFQAPVFSALFRAYIGLTFFFNLISVEPLQDLVPGCCGQNNKVAARDKTRLPWGMDRLFEELDFRPTPLGDLILRRRRMVMLDNLIVHEVLLGDAFLMSSLFHVVEEALADLGLAAVEGVDLDVVVGGLGLGYTAAAALRDSRVKELLVVDTLAPVIEWHEKGMVPLGPTLTEDPRCRFVLGDFFALAADPVVGFDPLATARRFHAILLDIDHSPKNLLHEKNGAFYSADGLRLMAEQILPGGVFALWSDDAPDEEFISSLAEVFVSAEAHIVKFPNPLLGKDSASTVYVAKKQRDV